MCYMVQDERFSKNYANWKTQMHKTHIVSFYLYKIFRETTL